MPGVQIHTLPGHAFPLPPALEGLGELAYNLWWTWHPRAWALFSRIDAGSWSRYRNPIRILAGVSAARWASFIEDADFMVEASEVLDDFHAYMDGTAADAATDGAAASPMGDVAGPVAYFCAEYGLHESMQIYSGGLGVLAGDHCKSASDAGLPFVAVGLLYRRGYFRQQIDADGHQEHAQPDLDPGVLPLRHVRGRDGAPLSVSVEFPGRTVQAAVWLAQIGRIPLLLLDTDTPANDPSDRPITHILYVRGREMRLCQELILGIGGARALQALDIEPVASHLNEGHSAFLMLERAREQIKSGADAGDALRQVGRNSALTIHTPVAAGNEVFSAELIEKLLGPWCEAAGLDPNHLLDLGVGLGGGRNEFDLTAFVLRHAARANAVSALHAVTATNTWRDLAGHDIEPITNGVHVPSWLGRPTHRLLERALGTPLGTDLAAPTALAGLGSITDEQLWNAHAQQKKELIAFVESRLATQFARHGESPDALREVSSLLDPQALTIVFARRFATYKRAALLFSDAARVARLLNAPGRPVQIVFAGKAHPADRPGQQVIQQIFELSRSPELRGRVFILEDYDLQIARFLVAGADVWLNNPRRPLEASGTSGMKAAINGVPNLSVLDGWWDEGFTGSNGWAIGGREVAADEETQDEADAAELYRLLEEVVVPSFYDRDAQGLPRAWIGTMRSAIETALWRFSTARMLGDYVERIYLPSAAAWAESKESDEALARTA